MDANPDKIPRLNRGGNISISFSVQDNVVTPSDQIRVLEITLDDLISLTYIISDMCKNAFQQINAVKRISKFLTQDNRKSIYSSFIAAIFNYCPISWIFCGKKHMSKLEKFKSTPFISYFVIKIHLMMISYLLRLWQITMLKISVIIISLNFKCMDLDPLGPVIPNFRADYLML